MKISIITAVFNCEATIADSIRSLQSQSYFNIEHVIIDGASTDRTLSVIRDLLDPRSILISEADSGIYDALNKGIANSSGDIIGFLHADDILENSNVVDKVASIFADSKIDAVYGDLVYVKSNDVGKVIRYWKSSSYDDDSFSRGWMPPHPTFYVRRSVYERLGNFDTRYRISSDYDCILRFLTKGNINAVYLPEVLVRMRVGGISNRSFKMIFLKTYEDFKILRGNSVGGIYSLICKNIRKLNQFWRV